MNGRPWHRAPATGGAGSVDPPSCARPPDTGTRPAPERARAGGARLLLAATRHRRAAGTRVFARARVARGPRTRYGTRAAPATSGLVPPASGRHRPAGARRPRRAPAWREAAR
ncbi:hypothetical protein [Streptomyces sp. NPDC052701]|uniref:hypothetical protein n=1 Tax=Streptomyces sp. NPDC052701 TaxID=3155533 RepID=UPI003425B7CF